MNGPFVGGPITSQNKSKIADGGHIKFCKKLTSPTEDIWTQCRTKMQHGEQLQDDFRPTM